MDHILLITLATYKWVCPRTLGTFQFWLPWNQLDITPQLVNQTTIVDQLHSKIENFSFQIIVEDYQALLITPPPPHELILVISDIILYILKSPFYLKSTSLTFDLIMTVSPPQTQVEPPLPWTTMINHLLSYLGLYIAL